MKALSIRHLTKNQQAKAKIPEYVRYFYFGTRPGTGGRVFFIPTESVTFLKAGSTSVFTFARGSVQAVFSLSLFWTGQHILL
ncbi:hypothetical protein [Sporomusa sp. GT1]|uniref:hypothetical protein n=1 Tax=Sporomusa sp. GT1 TaxID=1534747 RepID=UPI001CB8234E|nr:hypothetical protein [Sporomusa sp. GT1]